MDKDNGGIKMPNITIYLENNLFSKWIQLSAKRQKELRKDFINAVITEKHKNKGE